MVLNISQCCSTWWSEVLKKVKKAVVFIDRSTAECFHWSSDLMEFYNAGAIAVKEFSSFENGEKNHKKAVFITSGYGNNIEVIKTIIKNSKFEYCMMISTAHPSILSLDRYKQNNIDNEMQAFTLLENDILEWMGNKDYTVEIFYFPLFLAPITDNFFITPAFSDMFPPLEQNFVNPQAESPFRSLKNDVQISIRHLVTLLHSLFGIMDIKDEIYSLGDFSAIVASMLDNFPAVANRRKTATNSASLILVDRTLDLCGALSHNTDSFLDSIKMVLPKFPGHSTDVAVDMSSICITKSENLIEDIQLAPGCLAHPSTEKGREMIESLIHEKQKKILSDIFFSLSTIKDGPVVRSPPRITLQCIEKNIHNFKGDYTVIEKNCALLQQTLAVIQTLKSPEMPKIQLKMSLEQIILQNLAASKNSTSILLQLSQIVKSRKSRGLLLEDIFCLLLYVYSLAGSDITFSENQEQELLETLVQALIDDNWECSSEIDQHQKAFATNLISKLKLASKTRLGLVRYKSLVNSTDSSEPAEIKGVLQRLIEDLLDPERKEIIDLASKSVGITDLFKSSLSLLMNKPKRPSHPVDNKLIIIFVIGGIRAHEVSLIQNLFANSSNDMNVIVGSTQLITPIDAMRIVLDLNK